jgi:hypothetical protein
LSRIYSGESSFRFADSSTSIVDGSELVIAELYPVFSGGNHEDMYGVRLQMMQ